MNQKILTFIIMLLLFTGCGEPQVEQKPKQIPENSFIWNEHSAEKLSQNEYDDAMIKYVALKYPKKAKEYKETLPWKDEETGLIWQRKVEDNIYNWSDAKNYCSRLILAGYSNWKLPTIDELKSIRTENSYKNTQSSRGKTYIKKPLLESMFINKYHSFWSDTEKDYSTAWGVLFLNANDYFYTKSRELLVRCVVGRQ